VRLRALYLAGELLPEAKTAANPHG
jgi:hypothetical protein